MAPMRSASAESDTLINGDPSFALAMGILVSNIMIMVIWISLWACGCCEKKREQDVNKASIGGPSMSPSKAAQRDSFVSDKASFGTRTTSGTSTPKAMRLSLSRSSNDIYEKNAKNAPPLTLESWKQEEKKDGLTYGAPQSSMDRDAVKMSSLALMSSTRVQPVLKSTTVSLSSRTIESKSSVAGSSKSTTDVDSVGVIVSNQGGAKKIQSITFAKEVKKK